MKNKYTINPNKVKQTKKGNKSTQSENNKEDINIQKNIEELKIYNANLKMEYDYLKSKENNVNKLIYYDSVESLGDNYIKHEISFYRNNNEFLSKHYFDLISKLKLDIRKNNYEHNRLLEENKNIMQNNLIILEKRLSDYEKKQKHDIEELQNNNKRLAEMLDDLSSVLKKG